MDRSLFLAQVDLLLRILPYVMRDSRFALKGGSALNLFIRDLPRLSVDIDLTYLPIEDRDSTLANISDILSTISKDISRTMPQVTIQALKATDGRLRKLVVRSGLVTVKVEPNETIRGSIFPCELRDLAPQVEEEFVGMSRVPVTCEELIAVRERLIDLLRLSLSIDEKRFLLSVKELEPDWTLLGVTGVDELPAVRWKLQNLTKMPKPKHRLAVAKLKEVLDL
jgi:Nucleotidyl transferase AbiEii toxin, Type IV TA system